MCVLCCAGDVDSERVCRTFHALLYTALIQYDLRGAVQLVELVQRRTGLRDVVDAYLDTEPDNWPVLHKVCDSESTRLVVMCFGQLLRSK